MQYYIYILIILFCDLLQASMEVDNKLKGAKLKTLSVGGVTGNNGKVLQGFRGCIQVP